MEFKNIYSHCQYSCRTGIKVLIHENGCQLLDNQKPGDNLTHNYNFLVHLDYLVQYRLYHFDGWFDLVLIQVTDAS